MWESITGNFKTFLKEPSIQSYLHSIQINLNCDEDFGDVGDWPRRALLFGADYKYQGCIVDMHEKLDDCFNSVEEYIKVKGYVNSRPCKVFIVKSLNHLCQCLF